MINVYNTKHQSPAVEDALHDAMKRQWDADVATVRDRGITPDWEGEPSPLDKSLARVLNYAYENGFIIWTSRPSRKRTETIAALKFNNLANVEDAISRCVGLTYLEARLYNGDEVYQLTQEGEEALADWMIDAELMGMDVVDLMSGYEIEVDDDQDEFYKMFGVE